MGETTTDPLETARAGRELVDDWSSADVDWFALGCRIGYRKGIHVDVVPTDETLLPGGDRMPPYGEMWGNTSLLVELREAQQEVILRARYPLPDWREVVTPGGSLTRALLAVRDRLVEFEVTIDPGSGLGHAREVVDTHLRYDTQAVFAHRYDPRAWPSSWE